MKSDAVTGARIHGSLHFAGDLLISGGRYSFLVQTKLVIKTRKRLLKHDSFHGLKLPKS